MEVFNRYAPYYDLFYREKDYRGEVDYIDAIIKKYATDGAKTILDLGCGTGGHAILLAQKGYRVTGVDQAEEMLAVAEEKKRQMNVVIELQKGDICTIDLDKRFDVAIAMFAVMGYQTTNKKLESALINTGKNLNDGGLLIFDAWFGPAVIAQKPRDRIFIVKEGTCRVIRLTRPDLDIMNQIVSVHFTVLEIDEEKIFDCVEETHIMRFFFPKELEFMLTKTGFEVVGMHTFMALEGELTEKDWNMVVIARKAPVR